MTKDNKDGVSREGGTVFLNYRHARKDARQ